MRSKMDTVDMLGMMGGSDTQTTETNDIERQIESSLKELDAAVDTLVAHNDLERAVQFSFRALDVRRRRYGLGTQPMEMARIQTAQLIVKAARIEQARDRHKETAELLAHVDELTQHVLPEHLVSLDRCRRVTRLQMMKDLMIARFRQGRHRSALTFGKHVLELARDTMCLYELPTLHLNIASVCSALGQHRDALRHCYIAFQKICLILDATNEQPQNQSDSLNASRRHSFVHCALQLEAIDSVGVEAHGRAFDVFVQCCSLVTDELSEEVDMESIPPNFKSPAGTGGGVAMEMSRERRRWGGVLALTFRNLAAEQEYLQQLDGALLTYKVAHTTALACLGPDHPVCLQCEQALKDAEHAAKGRLSRSAQLSRGVSSRKGANVSHTRSSSTSLASFEKSRAVPVSGTAARAFREQSRGGSTVSQSTASESKEGGSGINHRTSSRPKSDGRHGTSATIFNRPPWNDWFVSDGPVPSHVEERHIAEMQRLLQGAGTRGERAGSVFQSTVVDEGEEVYEDDVGLAGRGADGSELNVSAIEHNASVAAVTHDHSAAIPATRAQSSMSSRQMRHGATRSSSPLPPRPATTSLGEIPIHRERKFEDGSLRDVRVKSDSQRFPTDTRTLPPISLADLSFLQNTFKLGYDIHLNRPGFHYESGRLSKPPSRQGNVGQLTDVARDQRDLRMLAAERKAAQNIAAELGVHM